MEEKIMAFFAGFISFLKTALVALGYISNNSLFPEPLTPEEENGTTLTGIWFRPLEDDVAHSISKKYQLYK